MATMLISRAQSCWGQEQWSDPSLSPPSRSPVRDGIACSDPSHLNSRKDKDMDKDRSKDKGCGSGTKWLSPFLNKKRLYCLSLTTENSKVVLFVRYNLPVGGVILVMVYCVVL